MKSPRLKYVDFYSLLPHTQFGAIRLEIGDGKEVNLDKCPRTKLQQQRIKYLGLVNFRSNNFSIVVIIVSLDSLKSE